jgi:hypothetical protein
MGWKLEALTCAPCTAFFDLNGRDGAPFFCSADNACRASKYLKCRDKTVLCETIATCRHLNGQLAATIAAFHYLLITGFACKRNPHMRCLPNGIADYRMK